MAYEKQPMVKVFSLWEGRRTDESKARYWSCMIGGVKILMFRSKSTHPQAPMFDVFVTQLPPKGKYAGDRKVTSPDDKDEFDQETKPTEATPEPLPDGSETLPF